MVLGLDIPLDIENLTIIGAVTAELKQFFIEIVLFVELYDMLPLEETV